MNLGIKFKYIVLNMANNEKIHSGINGFKISVKDMEELLKQQQNCNID